MALTKADMAKSLFKDLGWKKDEACELVDLFFQELLAPLAAAERVKLSGFGNLDIRDRNARPGRNPRTGK
jgi:integration host factor subunit alpha